MTGQQNQQTAIEARAVLDARIADREFGARVLAGEVEANRELASLHAAIHAGGQDIVAGVMNGEIASHEQVQMVSVAELFRELGIRDAVTAEFLSGHKVTPEEYRAVENWKRAAMSDKSADGFVARFLAGDLAVRQKMMLADSVLTNGVQEKAA